MNNENKSFEEIQEKTKEIIVKNTENNCASCQGYGKDCGAWVYCEKLKELEDIEGFDETGELDGCIFFIKNTDEKLNTFELKEGMKVKNKFGNIHIFLELINGEYWFENRTCNLEEEIDWEATKKINEVKEQPKQEKYIIWNPKGCNPKKIHENIKSAEQEAERLALSQPNEDFYVLEVIKKVRGSVIFSWE